MSIFRIPRLALVLKTIRKLCEVLNIAAPLIRQFVPPEQQAAFDDRVAGIHQACNLFMDLTWLDGTTATTNARAK